MKWTRCERVDRLRAALLALIAVAAVGEQNAQRCAAVLLTGAHGAAGVESSGLLRTDKWNTTAEQLVDTLLSAVVH